MGRKLVIFTMMFFYFLVSPSYSSANNSKAIKLINDINLELSVDKDNTFNNAIALKEIESELEKLKSIFDEEELSDEDHYRALILKSKLLFWKGIYLFESNAKRKDAIKVHKQGKKVAKEAQKIKKFEDYADALYFSLLNKGKILELSTDMSMLGQMKEGNKLFKQLNQFEKIKTFSGAAGTSFEQNGPIRFLSLFITQACVILGKISAVGVGSIDDALDKALVALDQENSDYHHGGNIFAYASAAKYKNESSNKDKSIELIHSFLEKSVQYWKSYDIKDRRWYLEFQYEIAQLKKIKEEIGK